MKQWMVWILTGMLFVHAQEGIDPPPQEQVEQEQSVEAKLPEDLASPRETMRTFLTAMLEVKQGKGSIADAVRCLDLSGLDPLIRDTNGPLLAEDLSYCIDKLEYIRYETIPEEVPGDVWVFRRQSFGTPGNMSVAEISIGKTDQGWLFTPQTLDTIVAFREYLKDSPLVEGVVELKTWRSTLEKRMPWLAKRVLLLANWQWLAVVFLVILAVLVERVVVWLTIVLVTRLLVRYNLDFGEKNRRHLVWPFRILSYATVLLLGLQVLHLDTVPNLFLMRVGIFLVTLGVVWAAVNIVDIVASYFYELSKKSQNKFDDLLVPLLHKSAKVLVFTVGILVVANTMGSDLSALLTGLGIGGLAFALAAKDTLANLFGSLTVLVDRPFQIGDWINIDDIHGMVEEVGFRSTRIRTFYNSIVTVPNSTLTHKFIDNYGVRRFRRLSTKLSIEYSTPPEKIEAFCEGVRQLILAHRWTRKDYFQVYLNELGASSLDIMLYVFWEAPDWNTELLERHRLLLDILRLGRDLGVNFAFPTQTLHLFKEETPSASPGDSEAAHRLGKEVAQRIASDPISPRQPRFNQSIEASPDVEKGL